MSVMDIQSRLEPYDSLLVPADILDDILADILVDILVDNNLIHLTQCYNTDPSLCFR